MKIGLITYLDDPELSESDKLLIEPLKRLGFEVLNTAWDDSKIKWKNFRCLVLRSCWNYHKKYKKFTRWLDYIEKNNIRLFNPVSIIKWNSNKKYLVDLGKKGIHIVPTIYIKSKSKIKIGRLLKENNLSNVIVVKPAIGASAYKIFKFHIDKINRYLPKIIELIDKFDVIIQPFMKEIFKGEYSSIIIGGIYSHTVLKVPKKGDYRSNYHFGANEKKIELNTNDIKEIMSIYDSITRKSLLYARIDFIKQDKAIFLMEAELIEPHLFFDMNKKSANLFATSLLKMLKNISEE